MNIITIDNIDLPTPTEMEYKEADLQADGYRDEAGVMHKVTVRWGVRTIKATWAYGLTDAQLALMRNAIKGTNGNHKEYVTMKYFCDGTNNSGTMTVYTGDMDYKLSRIVNSPSDRRWKNLTISFIEQ